MSVTEGYVFVLMHLKGDGEVEVEGIVRDMEVAVTALNKQRERCPMRHYVTVVCEAQRVGNLFNALTDFYGPGGDGVV